MHISMGNYLNLRYQWEELTTGFKLKSPAGTVDNLKHFVRYGHKSNRFRPGYDESIAIAKSIINKDIL